MVMLKSKLVKDKTADDADVPENGTAPAEDVNYRKQFIKYLVDPWAERGEREWQQHIHIFASVKLNEGQKDRKIEQIERQKEKRKNMKRQKDRKKE